MKQLLVMCLISLASLGFAQDTEQIDISGWVSARPDLLGKKGTPALSYGDEQQRLIDRDIYNNARRNSVWCPTDSLWEQRRIDMGLNRFGKAPCPTEGNCDDPAVRDATDTSAKVVNIYVHLMRNSDGTGGVNIDNARAAYKQMVNDYAGTGLTFNLVGAQWVNDSNYAVIPAYTPFNLNWLNAINGMKQAYAVWPQYVCNIFVSGQTSSPFGVLLGIATFPWDPAALTKTGGLWINNVAMSRGQHTFAHELGHCFGLWHTQHGVSEVASCSACYEFADGSNGDVAGDFCSDTPPTPTNYNCSGPGGSDCQGTPWGPTQPENFMGYGPDSCQTLFTSQQVSRMHCWLADANPLWITQ
ncbi:MAG: M43 family zinc metalloprotease [Acidobacteriota bacterium]|nr:M43 family zinc metalloprotease [Acidobacteriota bacterium]